MPLAISAYPDTAYFVWKEVALTVQHDSSPLHGVLGSSLIKGGPDWRNGPIRPDPAELRPANVEDFHTFRVSPYGHLSNAV